MNLDYPLLLLIFTVTAGLLVAYRRFVLSSNTILDPVANFIIRQAQSFFPVLIFVLLIRSFLISPFFVPTGSLEPTIKPIEFIFVNHFSYGLRMPVWDTKIIPTGKPQRGDIAVFHWPVNPRTDLVKRVIGLPGDHISYINKVLYINGQQVPQKTLLTETVNEGENNTYRVEMREEDLFGLKHKIYVCAKNADCPNGSPQDFYDVVVPEGQYFMFGDNRDYSDDSRGWGFVPFNALVGKAFFTVFSWDRAEHRIRWNRIGRIN